MKVLVIVLVVVNLVLTGLIVAAETRPPPSAVNTDFNAERMRWVPLPPEAPR